MFLLLWLLCLSPWADWLFVIPRFLRSNLYPVERKVGCWRCSSSRCQVCKSISITDEFTSFTSKKTYKINHSFDCNDKYLIYLLSCKSCDKQYVGNTTDHFRSRWNNCKSDTREAETGDMEHILLLLCLAVLVLAYFSQCLPLHFLEFCLFGRISLGHVFCIT